MFVHPIRQAVVAPQDEQRSLDAIRDAILPTMMALRVVCVDSLLRSIT